MTRQLESNTAYRLEEIPPPPESLSSGARKHWLELLPDMRQLLTASRTVLAILSLQAHSLNH